MDTTKQNFGSSILTDKSRDFLLAQLTILRGVLSTKLDEKTEKIKIVLASTCNTGTAICELSKKPEYFHGEIVMLSRAFIEKVINAIYLTICDEDEFEKYFKHTISKSVRKLDRKIKVNDQEISIKYSGIEDFKKDIKVQEAIDAFTSISGKEITHWTKASMEKRMELIQTRAKINIPIFMLNTLSIYEDASEALHGTLYGCSFFTWAYEPNVDRSSTAALNDYTNSKTTLILWQLGVMVDEVIAHLANSNKIVDLTEASKKNVLATIDLIKPTLRQTEKNGC